MTEATFRWRDLILVVLVLIGVAWYLIPLELETAAGEQDTAETVKSDLLTLNRTIDTLKDQQAVNAVNTMEHRLAKVEQMSGKERDLKTQRVLGESTLILLELHRSLKDRKLKKSGLPAPIIIY